MCHTWQFIPHLCKRVFVRVSHREVFWNIMSLVADWDVLPLEGAGGKVIPLLVQQQQNLIQNTNTNANTTTHTNTNANLHLHLHLQFNKYILWTNTKRIVAQIWQYTTVWLSICCNLLLVQQQQNIIQNRKRSCAQDNITKYNSKSNTNTFCEQIQREIIQNTNQKMDNFQFWFLFVTVFYLRSPSVLWNCATMQN